MPTLSSYDFAFVRVVPQVTREEFINAGVILFCRALDFLDLRLELDSQRMLSLAPWSVSLISRSQTGRSAGRDPEPLAILFVMSRAYRSPLLPTQLSKMS